MNSYGGPVTRGLLDAAVIRDQLASPMGSFKEETKLFLGRVYDALQIATGKIHAYDQIDLSKITSNQQTQEALKVQNLYLGIMPQHYVGNFSEFEENTVFLSLLKDYEQVEVVYPGELTRQVSIPTPDFKPVPKNIIAEGVRAIEDNIKDSNVYVHCKSGKGRSAVIVLAYVMKKIWEKDEINDFTVCFNQAVEIVTESRSANKVRRETDSKAGPLKDWFNEMVRRTPQ